MNNTVGGDFGNQQLEFTDVFASLFDSNGELTAPLEQEGALPNIIQVYLPGAAPAHAENPHLDATKPADPINDVPAVILPAPLPIRRYPTRDRRPPQCDQLYYRTDDFSFVVESLEPATNHDSNKPYLVPFATT